MHLFESVLASTGTGERPAPRRADPLPGPLSGAPLMCFGVWVYRQITSTLLLPYSFLHFLSLLLDPSLPILSLHPARRCASRTKSALTTALFHELVSVVLPVVVAVDATLCYCSRLCRQDILGEWVRERRTRIIRLPISLVFHLPNFFDETLNMQLRVLHLHAIVLSPDVSKEILNDQLVIGDGDEVTGVLSTQLVLLVVVSVSTSLTIDLLAAPLRAAEDTKEDEKG